MTAMIIAGKRWLWNVMPMGNKKGPAIIQRVVDLFLRWIDYCNVYLDNITVGYTACDEAEMLVRGCMLDSLRHNVAEGTDGEDAVTVCQLCATKVLWSAPSAVCFSVPSAVKVRNGEKKQDDTFRELSNAFCLLDFLH